MRFQQYILSESSISRIMHHVSSDSTFGVLSPFRKDNTKKENDVSYSELKKDVRDMKYGYIEMIGGYKEEKGFVNEKSLFIPNIKKNEIILLGQKYNQDSILFKDKTGFFMIGTNNYTGIGTVLVKFKTQGKNVKVDDVGDAFTEFFSRLLKGSHRGKKFLFVNEIKLSNMFVGKKTVYQDVLTADILKKIE